MRILAIESSCDETSAAVVEDGWKVLSCVIASSADLHKKTGGVVPEVAARAHVESIIPVVDEALRKAFGGETRVKRGGERRREVRGEREEVYGVQGGRTWKDLFDAIAVTVEPGLVTSLLVGTETAKWLGAAWGKPVIPVHHVKGHVYANWLERDPAVDPIRFPVVCLTVSGGHNELYLLRGHDDWELLGESIDDAAGEAFDKVARILGLGFPGGPAIERLVSLRGGGTPTTKQSAGHEIVPHGQLTFPRAWLNENNSDKWDKKSFNFSFSGLKSEVLREVERRGFPSMHDAHVPMRLLRRPEYGTPRNDNFVDDQVEVAFAFQEAVCDVLSEKLVEAARRYGAAEVHLAGGVSANKRLREMVKEKMGRTFVANAVRDVACNVPTFRVPNKMLYCTDNAAMIAAAATWEVVQ